MKTNKHKKKSDTCKMTIRINSFHLDIPNDIIRTILCVAMPAVVAVFEATNFDCYLLYIGFLDAMQ